MCDLHGKKLDYYCLRHDEDCCYTCKIKTHDTYPCECLHLKDIYDRLQHEMIDKLQELDKLRERAERIQDGSYQKNLLYRVNDEEIHLDRFYKEMKKKFKDTKQKIQAFTSEELSVESKQQLQLFISKPGMSRFSKRDTPRQMVAQLKQAKKQLSSANSLLYSLSNYVEITIDAKFTKMLTYNGDPVTVKGRPKYISQISSDEEWFNEDDEEENDDYDSSDDAQGAKGRNPLHTYKAKETNSRRTGPVSPSEEILNGVIRWRNNVPNFPGSAPGSRDGGVRQKQVEPRPVNKYEKEIKEAKEKLKRPLSVTPPPIRSMKEKINMLSSRSLPEKVVQDINPSKKLFLKNKQNAKFIVRERFQLEGCEDALVLKDTVILSMGDSLQKRDKKTMKLVVSMKLSNTSNMCVLNGAPTKIAVYQTGKCITIIETATGLLLVYRIRVKQPYVDMCHIETIDDGPPHPSYVFAATYQGYPNAPVNCIDVIKAKETKRPGRPPTYDPHATEINLSNQGYATKEIFGIGGFQDGHIVVGTGDAVVCISKTGRQVWRTAVQREISGILCTKLYVYACLQDHKKIITFNKAGFITNDNIIPDLDIIPCKISANWDMLLIKDFKTKTWVSVVFKQGLFLV